jgi:hypothetical protein
MQIHVDRYKHTIYSHVEDPFLHSVITLDPSKTRFHACERFNRCPHANGVDVVYINPVTMDKVKWEQYCALTESKLRAAQPVSVLVWTRIIISFFYSLISSCVVGPPITSFTPSGTPCVCLAFPTSTCCAQHSTSIVSRP